MQLLLSQFIHYSAQLSLLILNKRTNIISIKNRSLAARQWRTYAKLCKFAINRKFRSSALQSRIVPREYCTPIANVKQIAANQNARSCFVTEYFQMYVAITIFSHKQEVRISYVRFSCSTVDIRINQLHRMRVSLLLLVVVTVCQQSPVTCASCMWPTTRITLVTRLNVSTLRAAKLYVTPMTSRMRCSTQCTSDANCFYVSMDTAGSK